MGDEREMGDNDRQFVTGLARGLQVLSAFRQGDDTLSNGEFVARTGLPKATVFRLTHTLTCLGYLSICKETGRYRLHPHVLTLGYPVLASLDIRQIARPMMQEIADYSGGTVSIGMRDGSTMIFIERSRDRTVRTLPLDIGSRLPIATSAVGRAYLAAIGEDERRIVLSEIRRAEPERWPELKKRIDEALLSYEEHGYCTSVGEWEPDVNAVGVPLVLPNESVLAFTCGGPSNRISKDSLDELGRRLLKMTETLSTVRGNRVTPRSQRQVKRRI